MLENLHNSPQSSSPRPSSPDMQGKFQLQELEVWDAFRRKYERQFPTPERPSARLMQTIGWQFTLILVQSIGAITLASLRTAEMFFLASAGASPWLKYGEAVAAILTVEVGIVVFAAVRAEQDNSKTIENELAGSLLSTPRSRLMVGEALGLLISIVAGLGVSFRGFQVEVPLFQWVLSIAIGAGASIIAAVSGDILGSILARFNTIRERMGREHAAELAAWRENLIASWEKSPEREIARNGITMTRNNLRAGRASGMPVRSVRGRTGELAINPVAQKIHAYLDANSSTTAPLPGPKEVQEALGVSRGYASEQIRIWKAAHPDLERTSLGVGE